MRLQSVHTVQEKAILLQQLYCGCFYEDWLWTTTCRNMWYYNNHTIEYRKRAALTTVFAQTQKTALDISFKLQTFSEVHE